MTQTKIVPLPIQALLLNHHASGPQTTAESGPRPRDLPEDTWVISRKPKGESTYFYPSSRLILRCHAHLSPVPRVTVIYSSKDPITNEPTRSLIQGADPRKLNSVHSACSSLYLHVCVYVSLSLSLYTRTHTHRHIHTHTQKEDADRKSTRLNSSH